MDNDLQPVLQLPEGLFTEDKINVTKIVIVVGTTGSVKSLLINMLYNKGTDIQSCTQPCKVGLTAASVTKGPEWHFDPTNGTVYGDTIGLGDPNVTDAELADQLYGFITKLKGGVQCTLAVIRFGWVNKQERLNLKLISKIFDNRWKKACILVLTHYTNNPDNIAEELHNWLGDDKEIFNFYNSINGRVVVTNNCVDAFYEELTRPIRKSCLEKLTAYIDEMHDLVGARPVNILDIIRYILESLFTAYAVTKSTVRVTKVAELFKTIKPKSGLCPICLDAIELNNMAQTNCRHLFCRGCALIIFTQNGIPCPYCKQMVTNVTGINFPVDM